MLLPLLYIPGERVFVLAHGEACVSRARVVERADATGGAWVVSADDGTRAVVDSERLAHDLRAGSSVEFREDVGNASTALGVVIGVAHDD